MVDSNWKTVVDGFVSDHLDLATPGGSFDRCNEVSRELVERLAAADVEAQVVRLVGFRGGATRAHRAWRRIGSGSHWVHYAVAVGNEIVDCTIRQFDPALPHPYHMPVASVSSLWVEASVLTPAGDVAGPLEPVFAPRIYEEDGCRFYEDGFVFGAVDEFTDSADWSTGLVISEWSSYRPGEGNTTRALEWLRERYPKIIANGVGSAEIVDGRKVWDTATVYWQHMREKGLVDVLMDDDGIELDDEDAAPAPTV